MDLRKEYPAVYDVICSLANLRNNATNLTNEMMAIAQWEGCLKILSVIVDSQPVVELYNSLCNIKETKRPTKSTATLERRIRR